MASSHEVRLATSHEWLVGNFGPRCTLVSATSVLQLLGARSDRMVEILEEHTGFKENPTWLDQIRFALSYLRRLDRGIEAAAFAGGIRVKSRTKFVFSWRSLKKSFDHGNPVVLNCYWAPSGSFSHSVVGLGYRTEPNELLSLDPNDGIERWTSHLRKICSVTFVEPIGG